MQAQLSHARLGLSAAAANTLLASAWLVQVQRIERELAKLEASEAEPEPAEVAA